MTAVLRYLLESYHSVSGNELVVGGVGVLALAEKYGTPAFVYDSEVIDKKLAELSSALPPHFSICYSVKANPNPAVVRHFVSRGCGLEVASGGEFSGAIEAGCRAQDILFAGPGKLKDELELAVSRGIGEIHLESLTEAHRVNEIARKLGVTARVAIRVNPVGEAEGGAMRMGGRPAPFGVDEENIEAVLDFLRVNDALDLQGIHIFSGTQILDANVLVAQYRHGLEVARRVARLTGKPLQTLDFGGGLGIPYFAQDQALDMQLLRSELAKLFEPIGRDPVFRGTRFVVEPGRFLVGEAGVYLARVNDIKVSRGKKFLILDGGMNHHLAASGNLGQTIKRNYPIAIANKMDLPDQETVDVVGPLCTPLDTLARGVTLPQAEIGDVIAIFQSGAYGCSASPLRFLSHPEPAEVFLGVSSQLPRHGKGPSESRQLTDPVGKASVNP